MTTITIRNLDSDLKDRLKERAQAHGRSMEAEARAILFEALGQAECEQAALPDNMGDAIRAIVEPLGGIELDIPPRKPSREPPEFD